MLRGCRAGDRTPTRLQTEDGLISTRKTLRVWTGTRFALFLSTQLTKGISKVH